MKKIKRRISGTSDSMCAEDVDTIDILYTLCCFLARVKRRSREELICIATVVPTVVPTVVKDAK